MNAIEIKTNYNRYALKAYYELPDKARGDFDYIAEEDHSTPRFVLYRKQWYDVLDTQAIRVAETSMGFTMTVQPDSPFAPWEMIHSDSYFSGVVFKYVRDEFGPIWEEVICGTYFS